MQKIGQENNCIFIQLEPNITIEDRKNWNLEFGIWNLRPAAHPLFTKYTFVLDLTKSEEDLLAQMHPKTRYNIKVAQKHNVHIVEDNSGEAFETYWKLMEETINRQHFFAHTRDYHWKMFSTLRPSPELRTSNHEPNRLQAHMFIAYYSPPPDQRPLPLAAWILFTFHDTLYYPYGASSTEYRNVMASNLMMWEAIKFGKKLGLKKFDMWGSLGPNPDPKDPWYGFHRLKLGYNPQLVEFIGSYDLIINPTLYKLYAIANKLRWLFLRFKNNLIDVT